MTGRWAALLALSGALGVAISGAVGGAPTVQALGWAAAAGVGLCLLLRGVGLQVMGGVGVALSLAAGTSAVLAGGWAGVAVPFAALLAVAAVATSVRGPRWRSAGGRPTRQPDLWKRFDAGDDPTADADQTTDRDSR